MTQNKLSESEYRFASIVWDHAPVKSPDLVKLCEEKLGWKKSTTYTVLKKLCDKRFFKNENTLVTVLIKKEQVQHSESQHFIDRTFEGSLPGFITAFMGNKKLSDMQAEELKSLIDSYKEED